MRPYHPTLPTCTVTPRPAWSLQPKRYCSPACPSLRCARAERGSTGDAASRFQPSHPALTFGAPATDTIRFFTGYVACFDGARRTPKWVLERFSKETLQGEGHR